VRANRVVSELRLETALSGSDAYKISDHANPFFVRVYKLQRPDADCEIQRKGYWKDLSDEDRQRILTAVAALKRTGKL
jgi:hypothetical protein